MLKESFVLQTYVTQLENLQKVVVTEAKEINRVLFGMKLSSFSLILQKILSIYDEGLKAIKDNISEQLQKRSMNIVRSIKR